jgi:transposase
MQKDIAEALGVTKGAVSQWIKRAKEGGEAALQAQPKSGAPRRLNPADREKLAALLERGAESFGFRGELWTCPRVAKVIEREFGVKYHPAHVSRILKDLGWTPQKPIRRAKQRQEAEIQRWKEERWPALKKSGPRRTHHHFHRRIGRVSAADCGAHLRPLRANTDFEGIPVVQTSLADRGRHTARPVVSENL